MPERVFLTFALCLGAAVHPASAQAEDAPCLATSPGLEAMVVCGKGAATPIVLADTSSPSGKLAIAWTTKGPLTGEYPDLDDIENHLVRLADGKRLALVVGRAWNTGKARGNHITQTVVWSPDGRWLLVGDGGKWSLEALAIYAVDETSGVVRSIGLFRTVSAVATRVLKERIGAEKAQSYLLDISGSEKITVANNGSVSIPMLFQIPKEEKDIDLLVRFKASHRGKGLATSPVEVTVIKRAP